MVLRKKSIKTVRGNLSGIFPLGYLAAFRWHQPKFALKVQPASQHLAAPRILKKSLVDTFRKRNLYISRGCAVTTAGPQWQMCCARCAIWRPITHTRQSADLPLFHPLVDRFARSHFVRGGGAAYIAVTTPTVHGFSCVKRASPVEMLAKVGCASVSCLQCRWYIRLPKLCASCRNPWAGGR